MCFDEPTNPAFNEMPDDGTDALSKPQHDAIVALLNEATVAKAAEVCGVAERTLCVVARYRVALFWHDKT